MPAKVCWHRSRIFEEAGKDASIRCEDRIFTVEDVERHRAVVSVNNGLDAIPHVVNRVIAETVMSRIRIAVGGCVRIHDPRESAIVTHHNIRVLIERKEWRELCYTLANVTPEKHTALRVHVIAKGQRCYIVACNREQQPPQEASHHDPARALV